jgi:ABC-2 type transport system permease protein
LLVLRIARRELTDIARDGRARAVAAIVLALLLTALGVGWSHYRDVSAQHRAAQQLTREHWLAQPPKDPHSAAHYGIYAFKPRMPLSLVDTGVDAYTGVAAWLEAHKQNEFQFRPAQDRSTIVRFAELTAATILQVLVPILILLLAAETFAGEREQGTLRHILSLGVAPRTLAIGKLAGVAIALALVLVPAAMVGAAALVWMSAQPALEGLLLRTAALAAVYIAYFAIVASGAIAVSAHAGSVRRALALCVCLWAFNALVAPRLASEVAARLYPTPTAFGFVQEVQRETYDGLDVHSYNLRRARELKARLLRDYRVSRVEDLPVNFRGVDYLEREDHANQIFDKEYGRLWQAFDQQNAVQRWAGFAAPLMAARALSMAIAGTDFDHHRHFAQAAEVYRRRLVRAMNEDLAFHSTSARLGYTADSTLWASLPPFDYRMPPLAWTLVRQRESLAALGLWLALGLAAQAFAVRAIRVH